MEESISRVVGDKTMQNELNSIIVLREVISSYRRSERGPYHLWKIAVEEKVGIIFHSPTSGAVVVYSG
jgi:hypothetical protein